MVCVSLLLGISVCVRVREGYSERERERDLGYQNRKQAQEDMGLPVQKEENRAFKEDDSASSSSRPFAVCNGVAPPNPHNIFVYGNSRPDVPGSEPLQGIQTRKAWLLGGRLYSFQRGGIPRAAVRLEEAGHAVMGYVISTNSSSGMERLLGACERREFSPELYERDVVEVITEGGERIESYVYHRPEVDRSNPVLNGDWLLQLQR